MTLIKLPLTQGEHVLLRGKYWQASQIDDIHHPAFIGDKVTFRKKEDDQPSRVHVVSDKRTMYVKGAEYHRQVMLRDIPDTWFYITDFVEYTRMQRAIKRSYIARDTPKSPACLSHQSYDTLRDLIRDKIKTANSIETRRLLGILGELKSVTGYRVKPGDELVYTPSFGPETRLRVISVEADGYVAYEALNTRRFIRYDSVEHRNAKVVKHDNPQFTTP